MLQLNIRELVEYGQCDMPSIAPRCHELRINDESATWRIVFRIDTDAIVVLEVFSKKTTQTPKPVIDNCKRRLKDYDSD